jgi:hypothetical protein
MTVNAFLLSWDCEGIEGIVPITQYEEHDHQNLVDVLAGKSKTANPLDQILNMMMMRARFNPQRNYEIYAIDCDKYMQDSDWRSMFEESPQETANMVRERGVKLYSDRRTSKVKIT